MHHAEKRGKDRARHNAEQNRDVGDKTAAPAYERENDDQHE